MKVKIKKTPRHRFILFRYKYMSGRSRPARSNFYLLINYTTRLFCFAIDVVPNRYSFFYVSEYMPHTTLFTSNSI